MSAAPVARQSPGHRPAVAADERRLARACLIDRRRASAAQVEHVRRGAPARGSPGARAPRRRAHPTRCGPDTGTAARTSTPPRRSGPPRRAFDLAPQDLAPEIIRLQIPPHRVAHQDPVLGAPRSRRLPEQPVFPGPRAQPREPRVDPARVRLQDRALLRIRLGEHLRARRCGNGTAAPCGPGRVRPGRTSSESSPAARRRDRSISKKRSWACTKPVALGEIDAVVRASMVGTPRASRVMVTGAESPETATCPSRCRQRAAQAQVRAEEQRRDDEHAASAPRYFSIRIAERGALNRA